MPSNTNIFNKNMLQEIIDSKVKLTPMISQYVEIKQKYPDILLFFRMGDFYELFFDDAKVASKILNITLTHRGKIGTIDIPMAGVPFHAANNYVEKIISIGKKVAICEQIEDPKLAKGIVKREVTQIVSPGMPFDLEKGDSKEHRYMATIYSHSFGLSDGMVNDLTVFYLVLLDFTNGDFIGHKLLSQEQVIDKLTLYSPREIILYPKQWDSYKLINNFLKSENFLKNYLDKAYFSIENSRVYVEKLIPGHSRDRIISLDPQVLSPISALAFYVSTNQNIEEYFHIRPFRMESEDGKMKVSRSTLSGLEIYPKTKETTMDSLLGFMDRTMTSMGAREIKNFFLNPSASHQEILERQRLICHLLKNQNCLIKIKDELNSIRDLDKILAKISSKKVTSQDLLNLAYAYFSYEKLLNDKDIKKLLYKMLNNEPQKKNFTNDQNDQNEENNCKCNYSSVKDSDSDIDIDIDIDIEINGQLSLNLEGNSILSLLSDKDFNSLKSISNNIINTINDEIAATFEKGNIIKSGANQERDRLFELSNNTEEALLSMELKYKKQSQISNLKVKYNNIFGYFIEVSKSHLAKVPANFERKQTLVNAERFVTKELLEFEKEIFIAKEKLAKIEREIFNQIVESVSTNSHIVKSLSRFISVLDVLQSLAWVALQENFIRPQIIINKKVLNIKGGWHPLIKSIIKDRFVTHDLCLNDNCYFGLITGPNMAGKTTVMREMAIIQFLTQIGSFVPAVSAEVSLRDYLFSRVGASDDIMRGQSTFMVEMSETAEILRHATNKSLIVIDEVGRGTSTYDGLSIAWALVEHLVSKVKAITLFSTHYHELVSVVDGLKGAKNLSVETSIQGGNVKFLYRLLEKGAERSYGLYVAKLAGLPRSLLFKAEEILKQLEDPKNEQLVSEGKKTSKENKEHKDYKEYKDCTVIHNNNDLLTVEENILEQKISILREIQDDLAKINIMNITPIEAMDRLFRLQQKIIMQ